MKLTALSDFVGLRDEREMDPASMQFRAVLAREDARDCAGCMFKGQPSKVCVRAGHIAVRAGMQDCEERDTATGRTFIYVPVPVDPRQMVIGED